MCGKQINNYISSEGLLSSSISLTTGLHSGLYLVSSLGGIALDQATTYIVYWPEDTTWEDKANSSVQRNRVTFLRFVHFAVRATPPLISCFDRYLSKLTDQTIALLSVQQAESMVWETNPKKVDGSNPDGKNRKSRAVTYGVTKTVAQKEDVIATPGFTVRLEHCEWDPSH
jgi:hypothetical protein